MGSPATAEVRERAPGAVPIANDNAPVAAGPSWYRNYHRYYDPATGRYTQVEPLLQDPALLTGAARGGLQAAFAQAGFPQLQPYGYAANAPNVFVDLDGQVFQRGAGPGGGAFGGAVAADPASAAAMGALGALAAGFSWLLPRVCKPKAPEADLPVKLCLVTCTQEGKGVPFFSNLFRVDGAMECKGKAKLLEIAFSIAGRSVSCTGSMTGGS